MIVILATGPSMNQQLADSVRGHRVIAVSDAYRLAPWAEVLISGDAAWWRHHKPEFAGRKFCYQEAPGTEKFFYAASGSNSGIGAIRIARHLGATTIVLLGFDGHGSHFFGRHPAPLTNTGTERRKVHIRQHQREAADAKEHGIQIWNCTPNTVLTCYPRANLEDVLEKRNPDRSVLPQLQDVGGAAQDVGAIPAGI